MVAAQNLFTRIARTYLVFEAGLDARLVGRRRRRALRGGRRVLAEMLGESATLAAALLTALVWLGQPAFRETAGDPLRRLALAVTFLDRDGREIGRRGIRHADPALLSEVPDHLVDAVIATEDRRFYRHAGIDPVGLARALAANLRAGAVVQGGSTLTQQLAKSLFLTGERSLERKIKEAYLALWLEAHFSKPEILGLYFDRAYLGAGTFGIGAASEFYFGKPARDLTLAESAMLAGMLKAPARYAPHLDLAAAQARAGTVLDAMAAANLLSEGAAEQARDKPAVPVARQPRAAPDHYLDWAFREVEQMARAGRLGPDDILIVRTDLDSAVQRRAEEVLDGLIAREGARYGVGEAAMVVMEPDGGVRAMVGGRDYAASGFNRATEARRQPGSAFKPFVYAGALAYAGYRPDSLVIDTVTCLDTWCPRNYLRGHAGPVPLWQALATSINTIPVALSVEIGRAISGDIGGTTPEALARTGRVRVAGLAHRMGLRSALSDSPSLVLGSAEVTLLDMTAAYAVFADGGRAALPYAARDIRNARGDLLYARPPDGPRQTVLSPGIVAEMNAMLAKVPEIGTGRRAALAVPSAGKTGTTNAYRDAWYIGFTGHLVAGIWFGNDDFSPTRGMTGGTLPAQAWHDVMAFAHRALPAKPLPGLGAGATASTRVAATELAASGRGFAPLSAPESFREAGRPVAVFTVVR